MLPRAGDCADGIDIPIGGGIYKCCCSGEVASGGGNGDEAKGEVNPLAVPN